MSISMRSSEPSDVTEVSVTHTAYSGDTDMVVSETQSKEKSEESVRIVCFLSTVTHCIFDIMWQEGDRCFECQRDENKT